MEKAEVHYVYVLQCSDGTYYAGYTNDLERRIDVHNQGKGAKYTRGRLPVQLVYHITYPDKSSAMKAEYKVKRLSRKAKERLIEEGGVI
ncbi:GIY-YIG nuclease family protein [Peribacillus kribbensis]|uniref:GIY-YIG nuclease family protein n=1 Tax=Peribacillus kribbensis TaxID=356658 RepID=UPI00040D265D|nr:GIY-YIG nuclease family protein [Peribacillus kribbensis]